MKLLKLVAFFILFYFIRRIFQMYSEMKKIQEEQRANQQPRQENQQTQNGPKNAKIVDAEYKVLD
jgi:hypothetical protein